MYWHGSIIFVYSTFVMDMEASFSPSEIDILKDFDYNGCYGVNIQPLHLSLIAYESEDS